MGHGQMFRACVECGSVCEREARHWRSTATQACSPARQQPRPRPRAAQRSAPASSPRCAAPPSAPPAPAPPQCKRLAGRLKRQKRRMHMRQRWPPHGACSSGIMRRQSAVQQPHMRAQPSRPSTSPGAHLAIRSIASGSCPRPSALTPARPPIPAARGGDSCVVQSTTRWPTATSPHPALTQPHLQLPPPAAVFVRRHRQPVRHHDQALHRTQGRGRTGSAVRAAPSMDSNGPDAGARASGARRDSTGGHRWRRLPGAACPAHLRAAAVELREEAGAAIVQLQLLQRILRLAIQHRGALTLAQALQQQAACGAGTQAAAAAAAAWAGGGHAVRWLHAGAAGCPSIPQRRPRHAALHACCPRRAQTALVGSPTREAVTDVAASSSAGAAPAAEPSCSLITVPNSSLPRSSRLWRGPEPDAMVCVTRPRSPTLAEVALLSGASDSVGGA